MDDGDAALDDCDCRCCWEVAEGEEGLALAPVTDATLVDVVDAPAAGASNAAAPGEGALPVNDWEFCCWVLEEDDG